MLLTVEKKYRKSGPILQRHKMQLISHLLWYFSYLPDKWPAWLSGGEMLDVSGRAREKMQLKLETSEGKEVTGW